MTMFALGMHNGSIQPCGVTDLYAGLAQGDAEAISILAVMLDELLQRAEGGATGDEESTLVELPDAVMLHCVTVSHYKQNIEIRETHSTE